MKDKILALLDKLFNDILWGWYITAKSPFKRMKNVIVWLPVIWKDDWYSEYWLYEVMKFKIQIMEKRFRKDGHFIGHKKVANSMKVCTLLLDRLIKNDYWETTTKFHDKNLSSIIAKSVNIESLRLFLEEPEELIY